MAKFMITIEMEKPKCCDRCVFDYDWICCSAVIDGNKCKSHDCKVTEEVETWCPLIEVTD
jgi:hypothetical protein